MTDGRGLSLREPAHQVSPRAIPFWRTTSLIGDLVLLVPLTVGWLLWSDRPWWATVLLVVIALVCVVHTVAMPAVRFRVHRWEVTPQAVFTRSGWIGREQRIAPLSRVQTVDSHEGAIMRLFGLASITVTTASAAGPITIACLDADVARRTVAELTEITSASEGDAT